MIARERTRHRRDSHRRVNRRVPSRARVANPTNTARLVPVRTTCILAPSEWLDPMIWRSPSSGESNRLFSAGQPHHPESARSLPPSSPSHAEPSPRRWRLPSRCTPRSPRAPRRSPAAPRAAPRRPRVRVPRRRSRPGRPRLRARLRARALPPPRARRRRRAVPPRRARRRLRPLRGPARSPPPPGRHVQGVSISPSTRLRRWRRRQSSAALNPIAAARFAALARGVQGLGYRRTQVDAVEYNEDGGVDSPLFVGDAGVRRFIPDRPAPVTGPPRGVYRRSRSRQLANRTLSHEGVGVVSLVVERGAPPPPPKERLVASAENFRRWRILPRRDRGTAFTITVAPGAARKFWTARTSSWGRCWRDRRWWTRSPRCRR